VKSQGRLDEEDVPDLVRELSQQRWTGVLRLERGDERIGITIEDGHLVFAAASNPDYRLGPRLLRRGVITLRQMEDAGRALSPGKRLGTVLVEKGFLDPKELVRGVVDQTRDIILLAFHWTAGQYRLEPGEAPGEAITLDMSTPQLILDGVSQIEEWSRVDRGCGGLEAHYAPVAGGLAFGSELKTVLEAPGIDRGLNWPSVGHLFMFGATPATESIIEGVAEFARVSRAGLFAIGQIGRASCRERV
jgi:hypothetical protein